MDLKEVITKVATKAAEQALTILGLAEGADAILRKKMEGISGDMRVVEDLTQTLAPLSPELADKWLVKYKEYMLFGPKFEGIDDKNTDEMFQLHQKGKAEAQKIFDRDHVLVDKVYMTKEDAAAAKPTGNIPVVGKPGTAPGESGGVPGSNPAPASPGEDPGLPETESPGAKKAEASIKVNAMETANLGQIYAITGKDPQATNPVSTAGIAELVQQVVIDGGRQSVADQILDVIKDKAEVPAGEIVSLLNVIQASTKEVDNVDVKADTKQGKGEVTGFSSNEGAKQGKPGVFPKVDGMVVKENGGDESISTKKDNTIKFQHEKAGKFDAEVEKVARSCGITCENIKMASVVTADLKQNQKGGEVTGLSDNSGAKQGKPGVFPKVDGFVSKEGGGDDNISTKKDNTLKSDSKAKVMDSEIEKVARGRGITTEKAKIV